MLAWFSENDPLRRAAKPQFNPHLHASCVLLAFTAALLVSYVAKLILVVPLVTESFSVSRFTTQEVTPTAGTLPLGAILGTGAQAVPGNVPQLIDGDVQVLPRPRSAVVALLSTPLVSTIFITNATMWNATAGVGVSHALSRVVNASAEDPTTPVAQTADFFPIMTFPTVRFQINWSDPAVAAMQCMGAAGPVPPTAAACFLDLQVSACPLNAPCMLNRASAAYYQRQWSTGANSYTVRPDTTWMVRVPAGQVGVAVVRVSVVARSTDDSPFYTDPTVPRLSLEARELHTRPAFCSHASPNSALSRMKHWEVPLCPDPGLVLEVHLSEVVSLWLTSRAVSKSHLVVMVLAAMVSVFSVAKRMFGLAALGVRKCSGGRCGAVPVWAFALHVVVTAFALFASGLFTSVLLSNEASREELGNDTTFAALVFAWYLLAAIALGAAGLARLPYACARVRVFTCSPALAQRFARGAVRAAFVLMAPEMIAFYGAYYFAEQALSGPQSVDWWQHDGLLLGREVVSLIMVLVIRWLEWYNPESVFWDSSSIGNGKRSRRMSERSSVRRRRRGFMGYSGRDFSRGPCRGNRCCTMRCFQSTTFLANLITAFVVLIVNAKYTSNPTVAKVVLVMFGCGCFVALTALAAAQAASCVRQNRMMLQAGMVVGAVLCLSAAALAPWALSELERVVAHPNAEKLVGNYKQRLIVLSTQVPLLLRCAIIVSAASFWLLHMAFDLEPSQTSRVLAAARRAGSPRHSSASFDAYAELAGSSDDDGMDVGLPTASMRRQESEAKLRRGLPLCCFRWCCRLNFEQEVADGATPARGDEAHNTRGGGERGARVSWAPSVAHAGAGGDTGVFTGPGAGHGGSGEAPVLNSSWVPRHGYGNESAMAATTDSGQAPESAASMFMALRSRSTSASYKRRGLDQSTVGASGTSSDAGAGPGPGLSLQPLSSRARFVAPAATDAAPGSAAGPAQTAFEGGTAASPPSPPHAAALVQDPVDDEQATLYAPPLPSTTPPAASVLAEPTF